MFIYVWRQKKYLKNGRQDFFQFKEDDYYYFVPSSKQHRDHQHWLQCHSIPSRPSATWRTPRTRTLSTCTWLRYVKMSQAHRTAAEAATIPFQKHVHQKLVRRYFLILLLFVCVMNRAYWHNSFYFFPALFLSFSLSLFLFYLFLKPASSRAIRSSAQKNYEVNWRRLFTTCRKRWGGIVEFGWWWW